MLINCKNVQLFSFQVKQTSDMAGWRYRAVVRVIEGDVPITGAETRFTICKNDFAF